MKKYLCEACGYIYDPEVGDPDRIMHKKYRSSSQADDERFLFYFPV